ncbi:hypothetical protein BDA96_03G367700 [Sorghum bicolor]|uniref:Uncharacterized protein n=1 Tax=Sorghum bicolor TaxID=4558 RepID=A0A921UQ15_SORBI|nr:hypothetical protein BDA96_03G367700 [Sorghum bicolor]
MANTSKSCLFCMTSEIFTVTAHHPDCRIPWLCEPVSSPVSPLVKGIKLITGFFLPSGEFRRIQYQLISSQPSTSVEQCY